MIAKHRINQQPDVNRIMFRFTHFGAPGGPSAGFVPDCLAFIALTTIAQNGELFGGGGNPMGAPIGGGVPGNFGGVPDLSEGSALICKLQKVKSKLQFLA